MSCSAAGKLDRQILIEQNTPVQDGFGQPIESWGTLATVWAEKLNPKVAEKYVGDKFVPTRSIVWRIRFRGDVTELMRVVYNSNNYGIIGTYEEGRRKYLIVVTEALL